MKRHRALVQGTLEQGSRNATNAGGQGGPAWDVLLGVRCRRGPPDRIGSCKDSDANTDCRAMFKLLLAVLPAARLGLCL